MDPLTGGKEPSDRERIDQAAQQAEMEAAADARRSNAKDGLAARQSIEGRTEEDPEPDELFPMGTLPGDNLHPSKIIKKGLSTELAVAISRAAVPIAEGGGLFDPDKRGRVLLHYVPGKLTEQPFRKGDDQRVTSWKVVQELTAVYVEHANEEEPLIKSEFDNLLALDNERAGKLLDELREMFIETQGEVAAA